MVFDEHNQKYICPECGKGLLEEQFENEYVCRGCNKYFSLDNDNNLV